MLILAVSICAFSISLILDLLLSALSAPLQFLIQVPTLVLLISEVRRIALSYAPQLNLNEQDVNDAFFFTAPLSALAAMSLFTNIRKIIKPLRY